MLSTTLNNIRNKLLFKLLYRWVQIGKNVHCQYSTRFWAPHRHTVLGDNVGIGHNCHFLCDIEIGNKVLIASYCSFLNSDDHNYKIIGKTMWDSGRGDKYNIIISDDVWIGQAAMLLSPVKVGRGAIVSAGSVVVKDVPPYAIVGGIPARVISWRFTVEEIIEHERIMITNGEMSEHDRTDVSLLPARM
ncbi:MAG: acyltransferase [Desulfuromonadaceae bacterium]|nr:acyltransferase [Desulfuromonadaceae bacterium]